MSDTAPEPAPELMEAALAGDLEAIQKLADLYESTNPLGPDHLLWRQRAFQAGDYESGANLILQYEKMGKSEELTDLYQAFESCHEHLWVSMLALYLKSNGFPEKAVYWYEKAVEFGDDTDSPEDLMLLHEELGNEEEAERWRAYVNGEALPLADGVGYDERSGEIVIQITDEKTQEALRPLMEATQRDRKAEQELKKDWDRHSATARAHAGLPKAMDALADFLETEDPDSSRIWREKSAVGGNPVAMLKMGRFAKEDGDFDSALRWWGLAHESGAERGAINIANMFEEQGDTVRAKELLVGAAQAGEVSVIKALIALLKKLSSTEDVSVWEAKLRETQSALDRQKDDDRQQLEVEAKAGDAESIFLLGMFHQNEARNPKKAVTLFLQAAELGNAEAMNMLGVNAKWEEEDLASAADWFERSGAAGSSRGYENLADIFNNRGDFDSARSSLEKAAALDSNTARYALAELYFRAGDLENCDAWLTRAVEQETRAHNSPQ